MFHLFDLSLPILHFCYPVDVLSARNHPIFSVTKGQMSKYWKVLVRVVRSRNVAEHIRANLLLEKHRRDLLRSHNMTANSTLGFDLSHNFNGNSRMCFMSLKYYIIYFHLRMDA